MATYNVVAKVETVPVGDGLPDRKNYTISPQAISFLQAGDRVNFSSDGTTFKFRYFDNGFWTNTSDIVGSGYKIVASGLAQDATDNILIYDNNTITDIDFNVTHKTVDTTPNQFNFPDRTNIDPKAQVVSFAQITGFNTAVQATVSATGSGYFGFRNAGSGQLKTSGWVSPNETIVVVVEAPHDYEALTRTVTVTIGGVTDTFKVVTRQWPLPEQVYHMGISAPQDLYLRQHIATFFGGEYEPLLSDYLRGGGLVPSIQENEHVPRSLPIHITDLYDTASALYFLFKPPDKGEGANTLDGGKTLSLAWDILTDYTVGYGELSRYLEYRYTFTSSNEELQHTTGSPSDVTIHSSRGAPGTWHQDNGKVWLTVTAPQNVERWYKGTITIYCRNAIDTSLVISRTVDWSMFFYGP